MGLDPDGDTEPLGQRDARLEHPRRGPELLLAGRRVAGRSAPPKTRTSGADSQSLASSRNRRSSGPGSSSVRRIELSTATTGRPGRGQGPPDPGAVRGGHRRVDELPVDEPEFDARVTPAPAER